MRPELPVKLYYRIGEVAEVVGVEPHVLRYWESEFGTIRPQKSPKGQRVYSRRDLEKLLRVKELLYDEGYTIAGAKKRMREALHEPNSGGRGGAMPSPSETPVAGAVPAHVPATAPVASAALVAVASSSAAVSSLPQVPVATAPGTKPVVAPAPAPAPAASVLSSATSASFGAFVLQGAGFHFQTTEELPTQVRADLVDLRAWLRAELANLS